MANFKIMGIYANKDVEKDQVAIAKDYEKPLLCLCDKSPKLDCS